MVTLFHSSQLLRPKMWKLALLLALATALRGVASAQVAGTGICPRPAAGSEVEAPREIRSRDGVLRVRLAFRNTVLPSGERLYCYADENGNQSPTLRLKPGDLLILKLKNEGEGVPKSAKSSPSAPQNSCASFEVHSGNMHAEMPDDSTNLHFHGLSIPPICHQDDVLHTVLPAGAPSYEYRVRIPPTQPPGLYWYHPHLHGHNEEQVLGGASGALIIEGLEQCNPGLAGLPERLFVIRDEIRPGAAFAAAPKFGVAPKPPAKDLSVNFVPVPYPNYPPALAKIKPSQRELWRVVNASADTLLDLHLLTNGRWQAMGLVAIDGVPLGYEDRSSPLRNAADVIHWTQNIEIPPGGRAEFVFDTPAEGGRTQLLTAGVDTMPSLGDDEDASVPANGKSSAPEDDDYTPPRWLLTAEATKDAAPVQHLPGVGLRTETRKPPASKSALKDVQPVRQRRLYFSEKVVDPKSPRTSSRSLTEFYITEEGKKATVFDPAAPPSITVRQGEVEDWIIENRSQEVHTFHIHQTHFLLLERDGKPAEEKYLRDTIAVPYWDGVSPQYPSIKVRIDFRSPAIVGVFPYHCHILQHEDAGMMGTIRVLKADVKNGGKN